MVIAWLPARDDARVGQGAGPRNDIVTQPLKGEGFDEGHEWLL